MRASPLMRRILAVVNARAAEREMQIVNSDDLTDSALGPPEEEQLEERRSLYEYLDKTVVEANKNPQVLSRPAGK